MALFTGQQRATNFSDARNKNVRGAKQGGSRNRGSVCTIFPKVMLRGSFERIPTPGRVPVMRRSDKNSHIKLYTS